MGEIAINKTVTYKSTTCIYCGVDVVIPSELYDFKLKDQTLFYCTNGHSMHFAGETEEAKLRRQLAAKQQELDAKERAIRFERDRVAAAEQRERKLAKRIAAGVCPHCQRTFKQLAAHVKSKHPK